MSLKNVSKPLRSPPLDLLKGFESAARHLSFTRAAEELHITQSAVSRQIKALEDRLQVTLFRRYNRALALTDEGQTLLRAVSQALRLIDEAVARLARPAGGLVTLTATISFTALWLVPRLTSFQRQHPGIQVRLAASNDLVNLDREGIDVAVRFCEPAKAPAGSARLTGEELFPVCSPALATDPARPLRAPADLGRHVLLHYDDPRARPMLPSWMDWLTALGVGEVEPAGALHFSHYDQLIQAAVQGEGVALGRTPLVGQLLRTGALVAPFRERVPVSREYFLIVAPGARTRPEVKAFSDWLLREANATA